MVGPFSALEAKANAAIFKHLANAEAVLAGKSVPGIFQDAYELSNVGIAGMAGTAPTFMLATGDVPANPVGESLVVGGSTYLVAAHQPDGTGMSRLLLEVMA